MKVLVIGSGLIGVTTAYFLRRAGHEVTVLDRESEAGRATSFANGALLTPSMSDPWNAPGSWKTLLTSLGRSSAATQIRLRALPSLASWGVDFLRNSAPARFERNALTNIRLGLYSLAVMQTLRDQTRLEYGRSALGSLRVFRDERSLDQAHAIAARRESEGLSYRRLGRAELIELEPALEPIQHQLMGAIYYHSDEVGDAHRFCVELAKVAAREGVEFQFGTEVSALERRSGTISAVVTTKDRLVADQYVVAAGSYSPLLMRGVGVSLPVRPAKGYSVTFEVEGKQPSLRIPVIDDELHAAVVPVGGALRVAGTAEFAGYDLRLNSDRTNNLMRLVHDVLPREPLDSANARPWCGLRPMSADGVPIIGQTPVPNLWVSCGHGHLGWTLAAGSAKLLVDSLNRDSPQIDPSPFAFARFSAAA